MIQINLLPWREEIILYGNRVFAAILTVCLSVIGVFIGLWYLYNNALIQKQEQDNQYLQTNLSSLDAKIGGIKGLQKIEDELVLRKQTVENLEADRNLNTKILNNFAYATPNGIFLTELSRSGSQLNIQGNAIDSAEVALFMKKLESIPIWTFTHALDEIKTEDNKRDDDGNNAKVQAKITFKLKGNFVFKDNQ